MADSEPRGEGRPRKMPPLKRAVVAGVVVLGVGGGIDAFTKHDPNPLKERTPIVSVIKDKTPVKFGDELTGALGAVSLHDYGYSDHHGVWQQEAFRLRTEGPFKDAGNLVTDEDLSRLGVDRSRLVGVEVVGEVYDDSHTVEINNRTFGTWVKVYEEKAGGAQNFVGFASQNFAALTSEGSQNQSP